MPHPMKPSANWSYPDTPDNSSHVEQADSQHLVVSSHFRNLCSAVFITTSCSLSEAPPKIFLFRAFLILIWLVTAELMIWPSRRENIFVWVQRTFLIIFCNLIRPVNAASILPAVSSLRRVVSFRYASRCALPNAWTFLLCRNQGNHSPVGTAQCSQEAWETSGCWGNPQYRRLSDCDRRRVWS